MESRRLFHKIKTFKRRFETFFFIFGRVLRFYFFNGIFGKRGKPEISKVFCVRGGFVCLPVKAGYSGRGGA